VQAFNLCALSQLGGFSLLEGILQKSRPMSEYLQITRLIGDPLLRPHLCAYWAHPSGDMVPLKTVQVLS
jgi:hypothetical protein